MLIHVVDIAGTTNENGEPIEPGSHDPANDILFLEEELDFWYLGLIKKGWEKFAREVIQTHKEIHKALGKQLSGLGVTEEMVENLMKELELDQKKITLWDEQDLFKLAQLLRKQTKPMIIACNKIDVKGAFENFTRIKQQFPDRMLVPCSAESELALREAAKHGLIEYIPGEQKFSIIENAKVTDKQKNALEFINDAILEKYQSTGVQQALDAAVFDILKYIPIFPGGINKLADQDGFLMPPGTTALNFAYKLHSDFGDKFIRAIDVKTKMTVGKEHKLKYGDVMEIVANK